MSTDLRKIGSVFRQGPNKLVFNSVGALHGIQVYTYQHQSKRLTISDIYQGQRLFKSRAYLVTQPLPNVYNPFNVLDKRLHRVKRQIIGQGVNERSMRQFEPTMAQHIDIFLQRLVETCQGEEIAVDMTGRCKYLGLDIIAELGFGTTLNLQSDDKRRFIVKGMETSNFRSNLYIQFPLLKRIGMEIALFPFIFTRQLKYYRLLKHLIVARRSEAKHERNDLYSFVVDIKDPETGEGMRLRDIWSEAAFFMPAGTYVNPRLIESNAIDNTGTLRPRHHCQGSHGSVLLPLPISILLRSSRRGDPHNFQRRL